MRRSLLLFFAALLYSASALAAQGTAGQNPIGGGLFLGLAIAYLSRRRRVGGWLLYFYMQLYGSVLITSLLLPATLAQLTPTAWESSSQYVWFVLSTAPVLLALVAEVAIATFLLFRRSESTVALLKSALSCLVVASAAAIAIDFAYFNEGVNLFFDGLTLFFAVVWLAYFYRSARVRRVFVEHNWDYESQQSTKVPLTPIERRYLRKRAAIVAAVTFVAFLAIMGSALGEKKPDGGIFAVPLFYAAVAAALGWYLPIRKKKRESLAAVDVATGRAPQS